MTEPIPLRLTSRRWDLLVAAVPIATVLLFFFVYLASPKLYLRYILEFRNREAQAVEVLTIACAALAAPILVVCGAREWRRVARSPGGAWLPGGAALIVLVGLASFFLAGEEISWGQSIFKWKTPTEMKSVSRETNLHNGRLSTLVHLGGNAFIVATSIALPVAWRYRDRLRLPRDWRPGVAEWPMGVTVALSLALRGPKLWFMSTHTDAQLHASRFYMEYLEEISEQREMLVAMAMLIYALYRIAAIRAERRAQAA